MIKNGKNRFFDCISPLYWFVFALILILGRFALLCSLYMLDTPFGGPLVSNFNRFIWYALYAEIGLTTSIAFVFAIISLIARGKGTKIIKIVSIAIASIYIILSGTNDEIMRWLNQQLTISYIQTYIFAATDLGLSKSIFLGDAFHFLLTAGIAIATIVGICLLSFKFSSHKIFVPTAKKNRIYIIVLLALAIVGSTSHTWFNPSARRWDKIRPVFYTLLDNVLSNFEMGKKSDNYDEGIQSLGGIPSKEYPFWKEVENETDSLKAFKQRSLNQRPDIILLTIESLRGWTSDMRVKANCNRFPNLCKLAQSGLYFPNAHSVGFPSIEGMLGIMEGVYSFPQGILLNSYPNLRMRSISEILSDAGYYTEVLIGSDPKFDNSHIWFKKWFDYNEYNPDNENDVALANRFVERYRERPKDKPVFYHWLSRSMHVSFDLPEDMGPKPSNPDSAYIRAEAYMDSALGIIMNEIAISPRANQTLIVLTGDHSLPNDAHSRQNEKLGKVTDGNTWISLMFNGPGIAPSINRNPVSQVDIAPSILGYLHLNVSNHFMGFNLLQQDSSLSNRSTPVFAFRFGDMSMREDSTTYFFPQFSKSTSIIAYRALLEPSWDTDKPVSGYTSGKAIDLSTDEHQKIVKQMQAAAKAWEYTVHTNHLMPDNKN